MKTDLFQPCGHCWVFQICWHIEYNTFTASYIRIWTSSAGIPSPSLALFMVMIPKSHLTLHSRISGSRWVITPSWLSGSWRSFLYSSSVYSWASLVAQLVKNPPAMQETWVQSLGWEDPLEKGKATHSSRGWDGWMVSPTQWTWVWVNSGSWWWTGRLGVLQSMGSQSQTWLSDWTEH